MRLTDYLDKGASLDAAAPCLTTAGRTLQRRTDFANDPLNLLAVSGAANEQKSDGDAATWLPPNKSYRCSYVARQIAVKQKYALWVTVAEREAMQRILNTCPGQRVPVDRQPPPPVQPTATTASVAPKSPEPQLIDFDGTTFLQLGLFLLLKPAKLWRVDWMMRSRDCR